MRARRDRVEGTPLDLAAVVKGRGSKVAGVALLCALTISIGGIARAGGGYYMSESTSLLVQEKRGVVLMIHGGGWKGNIGARADILMAAYISGFNGWGYRVFNLAHRPGRYSLIDTIAAVDAINAKFPDRPLCIFGGSSGGHLALMAAIERRKIVDCVIDQAGIPDLVKPDTVSGWQPIHDLAERIWGRKGLEDVSPMQRSKEIKVPVLVIAPDCDQTTSFARQAKFADKLRRGTLLRQYGGEGYNTGHCEITWASVNEGAAAQRAFLDRYAGG